MSGQNFFEEQIVFESKSPGKFTGLVSLGQIFIYNTIGDTMTLKMELNNHTNDNMKNCE